VLIVDTGVLVAATDRADRFHQRCVELLEAASEPLVTTAMVIAECGYLIERELGSDAESLLYQSIVDQTLLIEDLTAHDWARVRDLVTMYQTLPLGGTDASLIAIAERLGQTTIATLDHRHFTVVRPAHVEAFELIP
jgi:predicted nucleic acid-binding protein